MAAECGNGSPLRVCLEALRTGPLWGLDRLALGGVSPPGLAAMAAVMQRGRVTGRAPAVRSAEGGQGAPPSTPALSLPVFCLLSNSFFSAPKPPIPT